MDPVHFSYALGKVLQLGTSSHICGIRWKKTRVSLSSSLSTAESVPVTGPYK